MFYYLGMGILCLMAVLGQGIRHAVKYDYEYDPKISLHSFIFIVLLWPLMIPIFILGAIDE